MIPHQAEAMIEDAYEPDTTTNIRLNGDLWNKSLTVGTVRCCVSKGISHLDSPFLYLKVAGDHDIVRSIIWGRYGEPHWKNCSFYTS